MSDMHGHPFNDQQSNTNCQKQHNSALNVMFKHKSHKYFFGKCKEFAYLYITQGILSKLSSNWEILFTSYYAVVM